ncbi:ribonuclease III [uncultured Desulfovibrio sp.]|uniref:ribonuclease III n=1 Tax=uncultured Desulfovibrio sp. TaxID=167968 RepID=UPI00260864D3|nr:ribonuclease III [uncultured Desulfovibrio sp.]
MKKNSVHMLDEVVAGRLERALGYRFANRSLLALALTHSSWANEGGSLRQHNERLEFLGDAVLELAVSKELFERFTRLREGELTRLRSQLVSTPSLARLARSLDLGRALFMGRGEERQGGRDRDAVLSDAFEAVLAAVYEDGGFAAAHACVRKLFSPLWPKREDASPRHKDFKTLLQEIMQQRYRDRPLYRLLASHGPEHAKVFEVVVSLPDGREYAACGTSCKKAEQEAARLALEAEQAPPQATAR